MYAAEKVLKQASCIVVLLNKLLRTFLRRSTIVVFLYLQWIVTVSQCNTLAPARAGCDFRMVESVGLVQPRETIHTFVHVVSVHQSVPIHSTYTYIVPLNTLCVVHSIPCHWANM